MAIVLGDPVPAGEIGTDEEKHTITVTPVKVDGEELGQIVQMGKHLFNWSVNEEVAAKRGLKLCPLSAWTGESIIDTVDSMVERQLRKLNAGLTLWHSDCDPLDPELQGWVDGLDFGDALRHPLVYAVPYTAQLAPTYNARLKLMRQKTDEALANRDYQKYIWLHERAYRLHAFLKVMEADQLSNEDYWKFVGSFWTDSENIHQNFRHWLKLWSSQRPGREHAMDDGVGEDDDDSEENERQRYAELPETMTIYRGYQYKASMRGLSWSLDRERAIWFAQRFAMINTKLPPRLATAEVRRESVLAYFNRRNEDEVVVLPQNLLNLRSENLPKKIRKTKA